MTQFRRLLVVGMLLAAAAAMGQERLLSFETSQLEIETADGPRRFAVELAVSPAQQAQGLMFRQFMESDAGMLFVHERERYASMWMKNTYLTLDMLFIDGSGRISHIVERTVPHSMEAIFSRGPVRAVLELNAGTVARLGIRVGDRVRHPVFVAGG